MDMTAPYITTASNRQSTTSSPRDIRPCVQLRIKTPPRATASKPSNIKYLFTCSWIILFFSYLYFFDSKHTNFFCFLFFAEVVAHIVEESEQDQKRMAKHLAAGQGTLCS